jgi:hypothetical protein
MNAEVNKDNTIIYGLQIINKFNGSPIKGARMG